MIKQTTQTKECGCVLVYTWDTETAIEERVHTYNTATACAVHQAFSGQELYDKTVENEQLIAQISVKMEAIDELVVETTDKKGEVIKKVDPDKVKFSVDEDMNVKVDFVSDVSEQSKEAAGTIISDHLAEAELPAEAVGVRG